VALYSTAAVAVEGLHVVIDMVVGCGSVEGLGVGECSASVQVEVE